jgi:nitric oxide reductase large subunit
MDFGSVLGNGSYRGPEFTARTLHLVTDAMRDYYARSTYGRDYAGLDPDTQAQVAARVAREIKENRYDPATGTLTLTRAQAHAARQLEGYWRDFFVREAPGLGLPSGYLAGAAPGEPAAGGPATVSPTPDAVTQLSRFFFWTAWVSAARRPGEQYSYTNNWPYDPAAGNTVTGASVIWSAVSVTLLILLTGLVFYLFFRYRLHWEEQPGQAALHPDDLAVSPSQRSVAKFIVLVMVLFLAQTLLGGYVSHAFVEPTFFGVDLRPLLPVPVARARHLQLAIFWVATAWVAAGLYLAPLVSGREMRLQRALVNVLFAALVVVALGSLAGEWLGVKGVLGDLWWWMGNQGWEYLELGRVWQILLLGGLVIWWLTLYRGIRGALARESDRGGLTHLLVYSGILIPFFYGFGLFNTPATNLTIAEYWRWWVIHLWVEGVFEMFTVVTAGILLGALGLVSTRSALRAAYFQLILVAASGIIGTAHHYCFVGLPEFWLALGSTFSALEVIPLTLLGAEAYEQYRALRRGTAGRPGQAHSRPRAGHLLPGTRRDPALPGPARQRDRTHPEGEGVRPGQPCLRHAPPPGRAPGGGRKTPRPRGRGTLPGAGEAGHHRTAPHHEAEAQRPPAPQAPPARTGRGRGRDERAQSPEELETGSGGRHQQGPVVWGRLPHLHHTHKVSNPAGKLGEAQRRTRRRVRPSLVQDLLRTAVGLQYVLAALTHPTGDGHHVVLIEQARCHCAPELVIDTTVLDQPHRPLHRLRAHAAAGYLPVLSSRRFNVHGYVVDQGVPQQPGNHLGTGAVGVELRLEPQILEAPQEVGEGCVESRFAPADHYTVEEIPPLREKADQFRLRQPGQPRPPPHQVRVVAVRAPQVTAGQEHHAGHLAREITQAHLV